MKDNDSFVCYPTEQMGYVPGGIAIEPSTNQDLPKGCSPIECKKLVRQPLKEVHFAGDEIQRAFQIMQSFNFKTINFDIHIFFNWIIFVVNSYIINYIVK